MCGNVAGQKRDDLQPNSGKGSTFLNNLGTHNLLIIRYVNKIVVKRLLKFIKL